MKRRNFLKLSGAIAAGGTLAGAATNVTGNVTGGEVAADTLSADEMTLLKQLLDHMLPADEQGGGAADAGAHAYIDRALGGAYAKHLDTYRNGLASADKWLAKQTGEGAERIDGLLAAMATGKAAEFSTDGGAGFFRLLRTHMLEGVFGDPSYGGNRDFLGWQLIGYPGIQLAITEMEQHVDAPTPSFNRSMERFGGKAKS